MKTRVIQDEPDEQPAPNPPAAPAAGEKPPPDPAGRMRRWSARCWRIALWVTLAVLILGAAYLVTRPASDARPPAGRAPGQTFIGDYIGMAAAGRRVVVAYIQSAAGPSQPNRLLVSSIRTK